MGHLSLCARGSANFRPSTRYQSLRNRQTVISIARLESVLRHLWSLVEERTRCRRLFVQIA